MKHQILLYYKYVSIEDPQAFMREQREICERLDLKGRIIVSKEGLNGTVEGTLEATEEYCRFLQADARFADIHFKKSEGAGSSFPRLSVKVRNEIVTGSLEENDIDPNQVTGQHLTAEELHEWIQTGREFYIVDMRNDYEYKVGHFRNSVLPGLQNFRDLPKVLPQLESFKDKTILTVCTGGVRCEKASGFLVKHGFKNVYQLFGGIVTYMEKYPGEDFLGSLYVFDGRVVMHFGGEQRKIVGRCQKCDAPTEHYVNCQNLSCHMHFLVCDPCLSQYPKPYCSEECFQIVNSVAKQ